jgi:hypothetical protein
MLAVAAAMCVLIVLGLVVGQITLQFYMREGRVRA